jgi:Tfp pilus assembly protein PilO
MIKLTKAQRDQLIAIGMGALAVMACLWYLVVLAQNKELAATNKKCKEMRAKLKDASDVVKAAEVVSLELTNRQDVLKGREVNFAPEHEPFSWMMEKMRTFQLPTNDLHRYKTVSIPDIKPPEVTTNGVIIAFPYKWAKFHITGEGHYHDFGKFIADFENTFRYFRIQDLDITVPGVRQDPDMLNYSFDIVTPQVSGAAEPK